MSGSAILWNVAFAILSAIFGYALTNQPTVSAAAAGVFVAIVIVSVLRRVWKDTANRLSQLGYFKRQAETYQGVLVTLLSENKTLKSRLSGRTVGDALTALLALKGSLQRELAQRTAYHDARNRRFLITQYTVAQQPSRGVEAGAMLATARVPSESLRLLAAVIYDVVDAEGIRLGAAAALPPGPADQHELTLLVLFDDPTYERQLRSLAAGPLGHSENHWIVVTPTFGLPLPERSLLQALELIESLEHLFSGFDAPEKARESHRHDRI